MTVIWCRIHESNSEGFIARCYFALWANALERCELREVELRTVEVAGQEPLDLET